MKRCNGTSVKSKVLGEKFMTKKEWAEQVCRHCFLLMAFFSVRECFCQQHFFLMHVGVVRKFGEQNLFQKQVFIQRFASNYCCALFVAGEVDALITIIDGLFFISIYRMNLSETFWYRVLHGHKIRNGLFVFDALDLVSFVNSLLLNCLL